MVDCFSDPAHGGDRYGLQVTVCGEIVHEFGFSFVLEFLFWVGVWVVAELAEDLPVVAEGPEVRAVAVVEALVAVEGESVVLLLLGSVTHRVAFFLLWVDGGGVEVHIDAVDLDEGRGRSFFG